MDTRIQHMHTSYSETTILWLKTRYS